VSHRSVLHFNTTVITLVCKTSRGYGGECHSGPCRGIFLVSSKRTG